MFFSNLSQRSPRILFLEAEVSMKISITKATLMVAALGFGAATVSAQPLVSLADKEPVVTNDVVLTAYYMKHHKKWVYSVKTDGPRFRHKRVGYIYFYHGWWYSHPYWHMKHV